MGRVERLFLPEKARAEAVEKTSWAKDLSWNELVAFVKWTEPFHAAPPATIFNEGERDGSLYLLLSGRVSVQKADRAGVVRSLQQITAGKTFGEMALIDGETRSASVVVAEEATWLVMSKPNFDRMVEETPRLGLKVVQRIARLLSQRLRQTSATLADALDGD